MIEILKLTLDYTFKKIFANNKDILIDLINSVLEFKPPCNIKTLEIKNPEILPEDILKKRIVLDIVAFDNLMRQYDIEMQADQYKTYPDRASFYLSRLFGSQLERGEDYSLIAPSFGLHFLNYTQYPKYPNDFHYKFSLREDKYHDLVLCDKISLHLLELPKVTEAIYQKSSKNEWLYFLRNAHKEKEETMHEKYKNPSIHKAYGILNSISTLSEEQVRARSREKAIVAHKLEMHHMLQKGIEEGLENALRKIEKNMKAIGISEAQLAKIIEINRAESNN